MATYSFETITEAQAAGFTASDILLFANPADSARITTVLFVPSVPATVTLVSGATGRAVTFNNAIVGVRPVFQDASILLIGAAGVDNFDAGAATGGSDGNTGDGLYGGAGDDSLNGGQGGDLLQGNGGADVLFGGAGADTIYGGQQNDNIDTGAGTNFAQGNLGNDTVSNADGSGLSILLGGQGDDRIVSGAAGDFLNGNLGNDTVAYLAIFGRGTDAQEAFKAVRQQGCSILFHKYGEAPPPMNFAYPQLAEPRYFFNEATTTTAALEAQAAKSATVAVPKPGSTSWASAVRKETSRQKELAKPVNVETANKFATLRR